MARKTNKSPLPWLSGKKSIKVAVIGDLILDEYLEGKVHRISPEAPVPVHLVSRSIYRAGGAANVAVNIQSVGGTPVLFGVWGKDSTADNLKKLLKDHGISSDRVVTDMERPTIRKTRISANRQQIARVDWEKDTPISQQIQSKLLSLVKKTDFSALLVSDYGKGCVPAEFIEDLIALAKKLDANVIIDPKGKDYHRYRGAFLITPNRNEACEALGIDSSENWPKEELAKKLQGKFGLRNVLITLGAEGMYFYPEKKLKAKPHYLQAQAREVFDVSGAGDTVAAIMALSLASGCDFKDAMAYANAAAGRVVGKWGTQPILQSELEESMASLSTNGDVGEFTTENKIKSVKELQSILGPISKRSGEVVFSNGCFDLLHAGHISYLEKARSRGDSLVIGVNSDTSVRKIKGRTRPIVPCEQRMRLLAALACVDYVVSFDEETPEALISALVPNVLVKGADWPVEKIVGADVVKDAGGVVDNIDLVPGLSTSEIIKRVKSGQGIRI